MTTIPLNYKVSRLIEYINELSKLRQKPISSFRNFEEVLWLHNDIPNEPESRDAFRNSLDEWLIVKRPIKPSEPKLPVELKDWIKLNKLNYSYTLIDSTIRKFTIGEEKEDVEVFIKEFPEIVNARATFINEEWEPFVKELKRVNQIQDLYDKLFTIYQGLQTNSESMELILSIGLLQWQISNNAFIERHALVTNVELQFNKETATFTLFPGGKGKVFELEEDMLPIEYQLQGEDSKEIRKLLSEINEDEVLVPQWESIIKNISNALDSQSSYLNTLEIPVAKGSEVPVLSLSPAFILRKKTQKSFQKACDTAVEQLKHLDINEKIPESLANMFLGDSSGNNQLNEESENNKKKGIESEEFYFPLSSNEEQGRIIKSLSNKSSVLVQGPPGTGKTHTIANLTSHLLSTGNRVLITSHTAKALSVLKNKLPEDLQDLTVSYLGGDSASIKDLEKVVGTISINKERFDLKEKADFVQKKEEELKLLKQQLNITKTELFEVREAETYQHDFGHPYTGTAQQIAEILRKEQSKFKWYLTDINLNMPEDFWSKEKDLAERYLTLKNSYSDAPVEYIHYDYPTFSDDLNITKISERFKDEKDIEIKIKNLQTYEVPELSKTFRSIDKNKRIALLNDLNRYDGLREELLFNTYPNLKNVLNDIFINRGHIWLDIYSKVNEALQIILENESKVVEELFNIQSLPLASVRIMAKDLINHINQGGKLGNFLMKPKIVKQYQSQLNQVSYNGQAIKTAHHIHLLNNYVKLCTAKHDIKELLIPAFLEESELNNFTFKSEIELVLSQLEKVLRIHKWREDILSNYDFLNRDIFNEGFLQSAKFNIQIVNLVEKAEKNSEDIKSYVNCVESLITPIVHPLYPSLLEAINMRNISEVNKQLEKYFYYQEVMKRDVTILEVENKLKKISPLLERQLHDSYDNPVWEIHIGIWDQAFKYKRVRSWLNEFSERDERRLSVNYDSTEALIKQTIVDIGTNKAWINMLQSMTNLQSQHLKAWMKSVGNIGKGTGKNAAKYRAEAQNHMGKCIDAIPAWIMPIQQVFENFEIQPNLFDVVIIDEASQSWHEALLLKYIAKKIIIVGDDKQISPTIIGIEEDDVKKLQHKYFNDIAFDFGNDLNLKNSFFDICYIMFKDTITLREHFRCMPEIIGFSNLISYRNKPLIPLRQYPSNRLEPIKSVYLPNGVRVGSGQNAYNEVEADAIVDEIANCISNPQYENKTFGVISLLGANQAKLIQNKLLQKIGAEVMVERKIICGDAYSFQGDERDIIFLSMVAAKGATRITAMADEKTRQRFNVAVSRAKDQLWLMHSISVNDISNKDCLRYQLLSYIANPLKEENESNRMLCESEYERRVFDEITNRGYRVIPQYKVNSYRIDLVVMGDKTKLAVECDGDHWHTSKEDQERDFHREKILQRAGWTFWRVLGSTFYNNPDNALESLWQKLEEMGIQPNLDWKEEPVSENEILRNEFSDENILKPIKELDVVNTEAVVQSDKPSMIEKFSDELMTMKEAVHTKEINLEREINPKYEKIKKLLRSEGFEVLQDRPISNVLYVSGTEILRKELDYLLPTGIDFTFHKDGHKVSDGLPVWSIWVEEKKVEIENVQIPKEENNEDPVNINETTTRTPSQLIKELKNAGYKIIDNRYISETVWIIGTDELLPIIEDFKQINIIFRYLEKGHSVTHYQSAWFAKVKPDSKRKV